jgi:DRG Family Regulatory Proteins, Tma46
MMDKSPLKTLTLEDWLESERHKLTGTLTPVTAETFAKWKSERMDKKAAEEEAQKMKETTGRMLFESGKWKEDDESDDDDNDNDPGAWNLEALRQETELLREQREKDLLAKVQGVGNNIPEIMEDNPMLAQEGAG